MLARILTATRVFGDGSDPVIVNPVPVTVGGPRAGRDFAEVRRVLFLFRVSL